jgi:hypothetical protein
MEVTTSKAALLIFQREPTVNFLHYEFDLSADDIVEVTLDKQANVRVLDDTNYSLYRDGKKHRYYGGLAKESPVQIPAPHAGHWHVVVDLGGYAGTVRASARVLQGA